ncbi:DUF2199 domain-containing protein [Labedaea rhizosphaerae]|uniref:DUF2199 domain-containing protein n=1 Tax=Labedaea rhizosphaerae TaxID=598644 RepID=A0A4R6SE80_LABRH|nr:DUF2199 domain-containing protein [Labedaea rhizosphaerae]TDQ00192.1 hypothetical protein EV186_10253 [Labedaea rhizosphaerae]
MTTDCACGRPLDEHDRQIRFGLPDPVLDLPEREATAGVWLSHSTPGESVMMQVPGLGAFVRALLPVRLTGGYAVTYGVWIGVSPDDLQRAFRVWWAPEYVDLRLTGVLANRIAPWEVFGAAVELGVRDAEQTPWCEASPDAALASVLTQEWEHGPVLATLPG